MSTKAAHLMMLGIISQMDPDDRQKVEDLAGGIRALVERGEDMGKLALGLVGLEVAAADEDAG